MSCTIEDLRIILATSRLAAAKNLLAPEPVPLKKGNLEGIEAEIFAHAQEGSDLVELLDLVRQIARNARTPERLLDKMRVAVRYPLPENPFADGLGKAEQICSEAGEWLRSVQAEISTPSSNVRRTAKPALVFQLFLFSAILEYRVLHVDYVPAIIRSLSEGRQFKIHTNTIWAIPLSLNFGSQQNAERRLLILRQESVKRLRDFLANRDSSAFLRRHSERDTNDKSECLVLVKDLEREAREDPLHLHNPASAKAPSIEKLISAAQSMAMMEMPSVVVAHRSRRIVSHSLPPEVLARISGKALAPFKLVRSDWLNADQVDDAPDAEPREDAGEGLPWIGILREALGADQTDETLLRELANGVPGNLRTMATFALYLGQPNFKAKGHSLGGGCGRATVRRYCLLIATKIIPRVSDGDLLRTTEDAWEDALEEILDEDAFYHVRKYAKQPSSNAQIHSRPLVKAIRHWLHFLSQLREDIETECQTDWESEAASGKSQASGDKAAKPTSRQSLTKLAERLPVLGLVKVDASLITVDEYQEVSRRLVNRPSTDAWDRSAQRVALTLGYRCGLRRAEVEWLRLLDFDDVDFLHVRPTEMRALKTSNARRDLPLALLMPEEELQHIRERVSKIRAVAEKNKLSLFKALLFSEPHNPAKPIDFANRVLKPITLAFQKDERRDWPVIDSSFRFHRLRHSCASIQLLRLWPSLHRIASHLFEKNAKATMRWIGDESKDFREKLLGRHVTEVDLQAIALILGHGSASTSLEHYTHVADWYERPGTWED
jgi:integrase